jgi:hypothetical protein
VPRCFGYDPRPHHGDRFPCMPGFSAGASHIQFEPRHLDGPRFSHRGSHPTSANWFGAKDCGAKGMVKC